MAWAGAPDDPRGDCIGCAACLHDLAEERSEQEHEEPGLHEADEATHVCTRERGRTLGGQLREEGDATRGSDKQSAERGRDEQFYAAHRHVDEQGEPHTQANETDHGRPPDALCIRWRTHDREKLMIYTLTDFVNRREGSGMTGLTSPDTVGLKRERLSSSGSINSRDTSTPVTMENS